MRMYPYNIFRDPKIFLDALNTLQEYKTEYENNSILKSQYEVYTEKIKVLESNKKTIEKLENDSEVMIKDINNLRTKIEGYQDLIQQLQKNYKM